MASSEASCNALLDHGVTTRVPVKWRLIRVASVAFGVQFGRALQLSLLTPYVQELGVPHEEASLAWIMNPVSSLFYQPLIGHFCDRCAHPMRRRRSFIIAGAVSIFLAALLVAYATDLGHRLGDPLGEVHRPRAIYLLKLGYLIIDIGNNAVQSPCRALLADLAGKNSGQNHVAHAYFAGFMALGNCLGFAAAFCTDRFTIPFTVTSACSRHCAYLKSAFLLHIVPLIITSCISISSIKEVEVTPSSEETQQLLSQMGFFRELLVSVRNLPHHIWMILVIAALTWIGLFPFILFDTDWMGREIYGGEPNKGQSYHNGVRMGALGLMCNSIVLGLTSVVLENLSRQWGAALVWGISNIFMSICFLAMLIISFVPKNVELPHRGIVVAVLIIFAILGVPLATASIIPYEMFSTRTEALGIGQGLIMGILHLANVIPEILVDIVSGPWDQLFGGGNLPAFGAAAFAALVSGLMAFKVLPYQQEQGVTDEDDARTNDREINGQPAAVDGSDQVLPNQE